MLSSWETKPAAPWSRSHSKVRIVKLEFDGPDHRRHVGDRDRHKAHSSVIVTTLRARRNGVSLAGSRPSDRVSRGVRVRGGWSSPIVHSERTERTLRGGITRSCATVGALRELSLGARRPFPDREESLSSMPDPARQPRQYRSDESFRYPAAASARAARRRRQRHLRLLRRDLLGDVVAAVVLTILMLSVTAGLGALALAEIPVAGAVIGSFILERRTRRRRQLVMHRARVTRRWRRPGVAAKPSRGQ